MKTKTKTKTKTTLLLQIHERRSYQDRFCWHDFNMIKAFLMCNRISFCKIELSLLQLSNLSLFAAVLCLGAQNAGAQVQLSPALDGLSASPFNPTHWVCSLFTVAVIH